MVFYSTLQDRTVDMKASLYISSDLEYVESTLVKGIGVGRHSHNGP